LEKYGDAIKHGIKFAPFEISLKFSYEIPFNPDNKIWNRDGDNFDINSHFGFHGKNFKNSEYLISLKNT
jgi:hypothetical protein